MLSLCKFCFLRGSPPRPAGAADVRHCTFEKGSSASRVGAAKMKYPKLLCVAASSVYIAPRLTSRTVTALKPQLKPGPRHTSMPEPHTLGMQRSTSLDEFRNPRPFDAEMQTRSVLPYSPSSWHTWLVHIDTVLTPQGPLHFPRPCCLLMWASSTKLDAT